MATALFTCALPGASSTRGPASAAAHDAEHVGMVSHFGGEEDDALTTVLPLLARYDRLGDERALREALRWFDQRWEAGDGRALPVVQPLQARVCPHTLLQWSWLCEAGE